MISLSHAIKGPPAGEWGGKKVNWEDIYALLTKGFLEVAGCERDFLYFRLAMTKNHIQQMSLVEYLRYLKRKRMEPFQHRY